MNLNEFSTPNSTMFFEPNATKRHASEEFFDANPTPSATSLDFNSLHSLIASGKTIRNETRGFWLKTK